MSHPTELDYLGLCDWELTAGQTRVGGNFLLEGFGLGIAHDMREECGDD